MIKITILFAMMVTYIYWDMSGTISVGAIDIELLNDSFRLRKKQ